jgi:hypothetical protein
MTGIGMMFASEAAFNPPIEVTLFRASVDAMDEGHVRTLAILVTWLSVHSARVNADLLIRLVAANGGLRVRVFWSAVGHWLRKDRRFARLVGLYKGPRVDLLPVGTDFHIRRFGEDLRFEGSALRVPANVVRDRPSDVLTPVELARRHPTYRRRIEVGPTYRADILALLDIDSTLSAADLARRTFASFSTASVVRRDWEELKAVQAA